MKTIRSIKHYPDHTLISKADYNYLKQNEPGRLSYDSKTGLETAQLYMDWEIIAVDGMNNNSPAQVKEIESEYKKEFKIGKEVHRILYS